jgi:hypothetical protein
VRHLHGIHGNIGKEARMSRRDFFLVANTAAICSLLAFLAGANTTKPRVVFRCESSAAGGYHTTASSKTGDETVQAKPVDQELDAAAALQQGPSQRADGNHSDRSTAQDPAVAFRKRQELGERFSRLFNDGSKPDSSVINARIENRFFSEDWNQEWAGSRERNIRTLFDASTDLSGMVPLQITCRSKNCQVVFSASSQDQVRLVSEKFMHAATRGDVGMKDKVVAFFPDISTGRVVFYLSENGNMDLFQ